MATRGLKKHPNKKMKAPEPLDLIYDAWEMKEASLMQRMALMVCETVYDKISEFKTVQEAYKELGMLFGNYFCPLYR